jgi:hypothetical protein
LPQGDDRGSNIARQAGPFYPLQGQFRVIDRLMTIRVRTAPGVFVIADFWYELPWQRMAQR